MAHPNKIALYRDRCVPPLTQAGLAAHLDVHANTVQNWERMGVARAGQLLRLVELFARHGALPNYHEALAFWRSAARSSLPPPPELRDLFAASAAVVATLSLVLPLAEVPPRAYAGPALPQGPNPRFVGRDADLRVLAALLRPTGAVAVVCGLGGLGKTQLAAEFALRYGPFFAGGVCWIDAAIPETIAEQVAAQGGSDLHRQFAQLSFERRLALVRAAWAADTPRLLIFDNCEDPAALFEWRPLGSGTRLLVTSRNRAWEHYPAVQRFDLAPIERAASLTLLRSYAPDHPADESLLSRVAAAVGDLPLALHLAGRYLATAPDPTAYLAQLESSHSLLHHSFLDGGPSPTAYGATLAEALQRSYDRLGDDRASQDAREILALAAQLAPGAPIPCDLLDEALGRACNSHGALARLCDESGLADRLPDGRHLRIHHIVHAFLRRQPVAPHLHEGLHRTLLSRTAAATAAGLVIESRLLAQLCYLADHAATRGDKDAGDLAAAVAWPLATAAVYGQARRYAERAVALNEATKGPRHPTMAAALNVLALILQITGDYAIADGYLRRALAIWEQVQGPVSGDVATAYNNLGYLALLRSRFEEAEDYLTRSLAIRRRIYGLHNTSTARVIHNLGYLALLMGRQRRAARYLELALALRRRLLPTPSMATAFTLTLLSEVRLRQGDLLGARAAADEALALRLAAGGEAHDDVGSSLAVLAKVERAAGNLAQALALAERAVAIRELTLGPAAPETLLDRALLGAIIAVQRDADEGRAVLTQALDELRAVVGEGTRHYAEALTERERLDGNSSACTLSPKAR